MIRHYLDELIDSSKNILLLQGPIGSFFYEFAKWLQSQNKTVFKINLNSGDQFFYPKTMPNTVSYRGSLDEFASFIEKFCIEHRIDNVICFGDNRKYHRVAKQIADKLNVTYWAFEEGYFRPHYITLEKGGVNAFSPISRKASFFKQFAGKFPSISSPTPVAKGFLPMAKLAIPYYVSSNYCRYQYPKYEHHRILNLLYYIKLWLSSGIKRLCYYIHDYSFSKRVEQGEFGDFFIVPLQVYDDSQVVVHCDYQSVGEFLREVLASFAQNAPKSSNLIVKHHPMDRGFIDYGDVIAEYYQKYPQLKGRIFYIHDVPMPVLLRYGKGMVTINSTSGLSALLHKMPVKTLGRANYDFVGLTHQGSLDEFWMNPIPPDETVFDAYHQFHLCKTHINGSFYNRVILRYPYNQ